MKNILNLPNKGSAGYRRFPEAVTYITGHTPTFLFFPERILGLRFQQHVIIFSQAHFQSSLWEQTKITSRPTTSKGTTVRLVINV